jgi:hypothetical protein
VVADQLVLGLVSGGLLGPYMRVERRDLEKLAFVQAVSWAGGPERGEIALGSSETGETTVNILLFCTQMRLWSLAFGTLAGALAATVSTFLFDWLITFSIPTGVLLGLLAYVLHHRRATVKLRRRVEVYLHNTKYLPM